MLRQELFKDFLKNKKNLEIRNQLIELHLPLVKKLTYQFKYYPRVLTKEDLYQEGVLGLIKALNNYQDLGYDFISYATPTIKSEIRELVRKSHSPSIPQKTTKPNNISFKEEKYKQPNWDKIPNPHQLCLKQVKHELLIKKLKTKLSKNEFNVICLSFGISELFRFFIQLLILKLLFKTKKLIDNFISFQTKEILFSFKKSV
ncbi:sigma-70 family RNA polymerase sigma factor [Candidatus Phytoplasma solani]|uniref:sigma-70 family RNA polymerase sigma factor n=1 Tax=Candidatus Phytoplasma solani TaxID=69896 RepID=UPI00358E00E5